MSLAERIGLPDTFQTMLLAFALLLVLAPYVSGVTIGGTHLPRLAHRQRRMLRIVGPLSLAAMVILVLPLAALAPPPGGLVFVAADATERGEIDLVISNAGASAALLTRIELQVIADRSVVRPVLGTSAHYHIPVHGSRVGSRSGVMIRHLVGPRSTERIVVAPQTNRSMLLRVSVRAAGGVVMTRTVDLWPERRP